MEGAALLPSDLEDEEGPSSDEGEAVDEGEAGEEEEPRATDEEVEPPPEAGSQDTPASGDAAGSAKEGPAEAQPDSASPWVLHTFAKHRGNSDGVRWKEVVLSTGAFSTVSLAKYGRRVGAMQLINDSVDA